MDDSKIETFENWKDFYKEFNNESPRGAVLIAAAFLDTQLQKLLESNFINDKSAIKRIFDNERNGSLSTSYAKIQTAYCLGLINKVIHDDLNVIRKIRNKFAHEMFGFNFENLEIVKLCENLNTGKIPFDHIAKTPENIFKISTAILMYDLAIRIRKSKNK